MDAFKDLEELNTNLKKLRDSIYDNDILSNSTLKQQETFYKMLKALIAKTRLYIREFENKKHVVDMHMYLDKLQETITSEDINFYINTMDERLEWYYENEVKKSNGEDFIAAVDMIILWPLRAINERMYRYLFNQTFDSKFDKIFAEVDENQ